MATPIYTQQFHLSRCPASALPPLWRLSAVRCISRDLDLARGTKRRGGGVLSHHVGICINGGTTKSFSLMRFSPINQRFGVPPIMETPMFFLDPSDLVTWTLRLRNQGTEVTIFCSRFDFKFLVLYFLSMACQLEKSLISRKEFCIHHPLDQR